MWLSENRFFDSKNRHFARSEREAVRRLIGPFPTEVTSAWLAGKMYNGKIRAGL